MKEIIPLKKDILFKTIIGEITNINLDLDYKVKDDLIDGNVILSGTYKMTEASVLEEEFNYKVPFGVSLSNGLKKDTIKIEIDDFKYNISKDILNVNIDLELVCDEERDEEDNQVEIKNDIELEKEDEINFETNIETNIETNNEIVVDEDVNNITNIINNENNYYTYKVYIIKDNDNIESICNKYNVSLDDIKEYNDINELHTGDKIIIPTSHEL